MTFGELKNEIRKEYHATEERFFTEKALFGALLEKRELPKDWFLREKNTPCPECEASRFTADAKMLLSGEPIAYYLGTAFFCGLEFLVGKGVLIPRPETEMLVDFAVKYAPKGGKVFDLCCGCGCVGISVKRRRPDLTVVLFDKYDAPLSYSEKNACAILGEGRVEIRKADVLSDPMLAVLRSEKPDLVLSNPPYLTGKDMLEREENVRREPEEALFGGEDGLDFYRVYAGFAAKTDALFAAEIGAFQKKDLTAIFSGAGLFSFFFRDFSDLDRLAVFSRKDRAEIS